IVLNWDMFALLPTVAALLLFRRDRDGLGALALAVGIWMKFFPIVLVPIILFDRILRRRWRDAALIGSEIGAVTLLVNAPFALQFSGGGVQVRQGWSYFFLFNQQRPPQHWSANLWDLFGRFGINFTLAFVNHANIALVAGGCATILTLLYGTHAR